VSQEDLTYWSRFGLEPKVAFELADGRIGYCHERGEREVSGVKYARFVACVVFEKQGPRVLSIFEVPSHLVVRVEPFTPSKTATFGDFLRALKEGLFRGEK
jgi:hypothetical protein